MACIINAESGTGLTNSADGSGVIKLQSGGKTTNALAWVNFNGTGTVAIRSSYNVSSITDGGVGTYTVNFTNALADTNYSANISLGSTTTANYAPLLEYNGTARTTTALPIVTANGVWTAIADCPIVSVAVFGN
jgi:hypothetical protein